MNSRKFYEKTLNCSVPKDWEVHHIDENRKNNSISNLVAIPKHIHRSYHKIVEELRHYLIDSNGLLPKATTGSGSRCFSHGVSLLNEYYPIRLSICKCIDYRNYKLGIVPNIWEINDY